MDVGYRSPLFDLFRQGEVDKEIRLRAARGGLGLATHEQLAVLAWLADDADADVRAAVSTTIARIPADALSTFLAKPDVSPALREFFLRQHASEPAAPPELSVAESLDDGSVTEVAAEPWAEERLEGTGAEEGGAEEERGGEPGSAEPLVTEDAIAASPPESADDELLGTAQRIARLGVADRVKLAMMGSREERSVLIRDPNKMVASAVLASPKLSESEIEAIARMTSVSEDVLRTIATSRHWLKHYGVVSGLVKNPKTPVGISLSLIRRLAVRDLKMLSIDRNIPEALRLSARKLLVNAEARK